MIGSVSPVSLERGVRVSGSSAVDEDAERAGTHRVLLVPVGNALGAAFGPSLGFWGERPDARADVPEVIVDTLLWGTGGTAEVFGGFRIVFTVDGARVLTEAVVAAEVVRGREADMVEAAEVSLERAAVAIEDADPAGRTDADVAGGVLDVAAVVPFVLGTGGTGCLEIDALAVLVDTIEGVPDLVPMPAAGAPLGVTVFDLVVATDLAVLVVRTEPIDGVGLGDSDLSPLPDTFTPVDGAASSIAPSCTFSLSLPFSPTPLFPGNDPLETKGLIPPDIGSLLPVLVLGVGLVSLVILALLPGPILTLFPGLAAVGLRACGPVGIGAERGELSRGRADRVDIAELVEADEDSRSLLRPLGSGGLAVEVFCSRRVGERGIRDEEAIEERVEVSPSEAIFDVVRGIPARVICGVVRRGVGEVVMDIRSSSESSISGISADSTCCSQTQTRY